MTLAQRLAAMFEMDPEADDYYDIAPSWDGIGQLGWSPHWPPISQVWAYQGVNPEPYDGYAFNNYWPAAWERLQKLHAEYMEAKRRNGG